jgi:hypothetical protein
MDTTSAFVTERKSSVAETKLPVGSYTIAEWCRRHNLSVSFFYKLRAAGLAPRLMKVGARVLISAAADEAWIADRETAAINFTEETSSDFTEETSSDRA